MSDQVMTEQTDLSALTGSPGQKRKRDPSSPNMQRAKRAAPPAHMSVTPSDTAAYIESAIQATEAAAAANGVNVEDFNALQQATQEEDGDPDSTSATSTAQAALGMYPTLHVPPTTEERLAAQAEADAISQEQQDALDHAAAYARITANIGLPPPRPRPEEQQAQSSDANGSPEKQNQQPGHPHGPQSGANTNEMPTYPGSQDMGRYSTAGYAALIAPKPTVGSEEWHKMRKDNHKEVERRRRETINEGINELAKIVPGCEKNKGSILQRACHFIVQLKENEQQNIEKWTLEKLLTEQAITELSTSNDKLKQECERVYRELETWKRVAQSAGLEPPQPKEEPGTADPPPS